MRRPPWWAWFLPSLGIVGVALGHELPAGTGHEVAVNVGAALVVALPLFLAERELERFLGNQTSASAAIRRAKDLLSMRDAEAFNNEPVDIAKVSVLLERQSWHDETIHDSGIEFVVWNSGRRYVAYPARGNAELPGRLKGPMAADVVLRAGGKNFGEFRKWIDRLSQENAIGQIDAPAPKKRWRLDRLLRRS